MTKKNVLSLTIGPPIDPETWLSSSGTSAGLIASSVPGVVQLGTDAGQNPVVENVVACAPPGRPRYSASPRTALVPVLVTMLSAGPEVQPYSDEKALASTDTSCTAPIGTVASIVWRPHASSLLAPSSMNVVVRRLPAAVMK